MGTLTCEPCGNPFSDRLTQCPHCGRPAVAYPIAESAAFSTYAEEIQFAALTIDDRGLSSYGDAALFLRDDCIAHRASVFEDNIVLWMQTQGAVWEVPPGYRAPWEARAALGVAKLADEVTDDVDLGQLVLHAGTTTSDDSMLEVHVYGSLTVRSVAQIDVRASRVSEQFRQELDERAAECGFAWRAIS